MATKQELHRMITDIENRLEETLSGLDRGPVKDVMRLVVPIERDQLDVLRHLVEGASE